jgi:hypothetical protein
MRDEVLTTTVANLPVANRGQMLSHAEVQACNLAGKQPYSLFFFFTVPHAREVHVWGLGRAVTICFQATR